MKLIVRLQSDLANQFSYIQNTTGAISNQKVVDHTKSFNYLNKSTTGRRYITIFSLQIVKNIESEKKFGGIRPHNYYQIIYYVHTISTIQNNISCKKTINQVTLDNSGINWTIKNE